MNTNSRARERAVGHPAAAADIFDFLPPLNTIFSLINWHCIILLSTFQGAFLNGFIYLFGEPGQTQEVVEKGIRVERELMQSEASLGSLGKVYVSSTINNPLHPLQFLQPWWVNFPRTWSEEKPGGQKSHKPIAAFITQR